MSRMPDPQGRHPFRPTHVHFKLSTLGFETIVTHVFIDGDAYLVNLTPQAALLSRSNFGSGSAASGAKMRQALEIVRAQAPDLEIDGEMHGDCVLDESLRARILPTPPLKGDANLLVCPNVDSGNIAYNLLKTGAGSNIAVGPFLLGVNAPVNILTSSSTVRRIINMAALTVIEANRAQ
ncbi:hypothetical protein DN412_37185 [Cupriavidus lacunae]|uniref:Phosphate acetyl/butaryl transferase domain-containing protein n=2 Tax=Cupriavidus lacunae TaxID=2666307 RepID=A0A370NIJ7_9BURK|nr:hypothetical protein DN412_37185 [Cupriavidus lacunae]